MEMGLIDTGVLAGYVALTLVIAVVAGRREQSSEDFFLGGRQQPWIIVGLSILATEVSALTFISVPAEAFAKDWTYLQMYAGAILGRVLIIVLLLPAFYRGGVTTVYEYLGQRFGPWTRTTGALLYVGSRVLGSGIRLLVASLALSVILNWSLDVTILLVGGIAIAYTAFGGIKAIIWTDAWQAAIFLGAGVAALLFLVTHTPGSWADQLAFAREEGKLRIFTWDWNPNNIKAFWVLAIHATVLNMAALGTDQDLTQRMLTCADVGKGQRSLLLNLVLGLPVVCLFLLIGAQLYVHDAWHPATWLSASPSASTDRLFPHFIAEGLPANTGLKGLLIAGVFAAAMSSIDSSLGGLSSTAVTDLYVPWTRRSGGRAARHSDRHGLLAARVFAVFFGVVLVIVALAFSRYDRLLWRVFEWVGLIFGGLLGVFLLGVTTTHRGNDRINTVAMLSSVGMLVTLRAVQESLATTYVAWPWWVVLGTGWTYGLAVCFRGVETKSPHSRQRDSNP